MKAVWLNTAPIFIVFRLMEVASPVLMDFGVLTVTSPATMMTASAVTEPLAYVQNVFQEDGELTVTYHVLPRIV